MTFWTWLDRNPGIAFIAMFFIVIVVVEICEVVRERHHDG